MSVQKKNKKNPHKTANHPAPGRKMQIRKMKARLHRTEHTKCDGAMMAIKLWGTGTHDREPG